MTAGEDFAIFAVFVNELQRFFDRFRRKVFKIIRNHKFSSGKSTTKKRRGRRKNKRNLRFLRFFVVDFHLSLHHCDRLCQAFINRHNFSGRSGRSTCLTPNGARASITALATAGVEPIVPASPTPLAPSGLTVVGVSVWSSS